MMFTEKLKNYRKRKPHMPDVPKTHPHFIGATFFYAGLFPLMPGTFGSLVALLPGWWIGVNFGFWVLLAAAVAVTFVGVWNTAWVEKTSGTHDAGAIVIDEVAGQWITMAGLIPLGLISSPFWLLIAFFIFRVFDLVKPYPACIFEHRVKNAWGVMLDDVIAGIYGGVLVYFIAYNAHIMG